MSEADGHDTQPLAATPATSGTTEHNHKPQSGRADAMSTEQSLADLLDQLRREREVSTTLPALATRWTMTESSARKRLQRWEARGQIICAWPGGGQVVIRPRTAAASNVDNGNLSTVDNGVAMAEKPQKTRRLGRDLATLVDSPDGGREQRGHPLARLLDNPVDSLSANEVSTVDNVDNPNAHQLSTADSTTTNVVHFRRLDPASNLAEEINARAEELRPILDQARVEVQPAPAPHPDPGLIGRRLFAVVLACLGAALAYHALTINWVYGASLGEDRIIAGLGLTSDAIALALPITWKILAWQGARSEVRIAKAIWCLTIVWASMSTLGFAALSVERSTAGTDQDAARYAAIRSGLDRLQKERDAINEPRSAAAIEQAVTAALADVPGRIVKSTSRCTDATVPSSIQACASVVELRAAIETARHREVLDQRIAEERHALDKAPAVQSADPLPEKLAGLINWGFRGVTGVTAHDVEMARLLVLALLPHVAGLILEMGAALWARRRV